VDDTGPAMPVTLDELLGLYEQSFIGDWYDNQGQRETFRQRGRAALTAFYEKHADHWPDVFGVEQAFNWKLDQYTIGGKIDRVDRVGHDASTGRPIVRIVDYKSGKTRKKIETEDKYQLYIYALAAQDPNILNLKVDGLQYYFMEDNADVELPVADKDLAKTEAWIRSSIERIRSGNFAATPGPEICRYCDYKDICEFRDPNA
ncbi:MAG: PD-(D/E)XK nuclease family protein, partial [Candidatus Kerfeldbacteria bacterium]|nr:PD-(D/E)XK nuclease family protein [Candidatus Kerfeldbacteria bacterium]